MFKSVPKIYHNLSINTYNVNNVVVLLFYLLLEQSVWSSYCSNPRLDSTLKKIGYIEFEF